jgi:hypothetical protein
VYQVAFNAINNSASTQIVLHNELGNTADMTIKGKTEALGGKETLPAPLYPPHRLVIESKPIMHVNLCAGGEGGWGVGREAISLGLVSC